MAEGRCNCAGITVSIPEMPKESAICYCSNCRRAGSCVGSIIFVMAKDEVHITDPKEQLKTYEDHDTQTGHTVIRQFCGGCGSPIMSLLEEEPSKVFLKGGLFEHIPKPKFKSFDHEEPKWLKIEQ